MPINYVVKADVVDLRNYTPLAGEVFLVDTNVWLWMTYSRTGIGDHRQTRDYPAFLNRARKAGARLLRCGISLAELAHVIERTEREISGFTDNQHKEFRHNHPDQRCRVAEEVQTAWQQVKAMSEPIDITVDDATTDAALTRFRSQPVDGYDLFLLEAMSRGSIQQVVTDDGDYCTVPGIRIFTSNKTVLDAAAFHGKLVGG